METTPPVDSSSTVLIPGVPYIGWAEAFSLDYYNRNILNPSAAAAIGMILKYWRQDLSLLKRSDFGLPKDGRPWAGVSESGLEKSLTEIRGFIDRGIPVIVFSAFTPVSHTWALSAFDDFKLENKGLASGILGRMVGLEMFVKAEQHLLQTLNWPKGGPSPARESVFDSGKVVIGYDDRRRVLIVHEPSFGPAFEIGYDEFEAMWGGVWRKGFTAVYPVNYAGRLEPRPPAAVPVYPPPTPDQRATAAFVFGYALGSVGRVAEGQAAIVKGLEISGVGNGMRHLLMFELALHLDAQGREGEAIKFANEAARLLPEHHRPWRFLAGIYRLSVAARNDRKAVEAERRAASLCADRNARQTVTRAVGPNFYVFLGC